MNKDIIYSKRIKILTVVVVDRRL